jgi:hypothetical protein
MSREDTFVTARTKRVALLSLATMAVAACSSATTTVPTSGTNRTGLTTTVVGATPSDSAFGLDKKSLQARRLKVESLLATCMKKQGFEYVPLDPSVVLVNNGRFVISGLTEDDFRKQYGYGLTTTYGTPAGTKAVANPNPNAKIRDALSPSDQKVYDKALHGGSEDGSFANAIVQGDFGMLGGCNKSAAAEAFGGGDALNVVSSTLEEIDKRVSADPQMVQAEKKWRECLNAAGFKFSTSDQIDEHLKSALKAIVGSNPDNATVDRSALAALQQEELRTAEADWACEVKHKLPVEPKVIAAVEKAYFAANPGLASKLAR